MAIQYKKIVAQAAVHLIIFLRTLFLLPHGACRYTPTCTAYAYDALVNLPFHRAVMAIIKRVLRCNPFVKGGFDAVKTGRRGDGA